MARLHYLLNRCCDYCSISTTSFDESSSLDNFKDIKENRTYQSNYGEPVTEFLGSSYHSFTTESSVMVVVIVAAMSITSLSVLLIIKRRHQ